MRVFVTGGTGQIGSRLIAALLERGDQVVALSRNQAAAQAKLGPKAEIVLGDAAQPGAWRNALAGSDGVVNLVGESLFAKRWSASFKETLRASRIQSTRNLVEALAQAEPRPRVLVSGSAIGLYGASGDEEKTEASPRAPAGDFLADLCEEWESAARQAEPLGVRVVLVRTGVVLDRRAGALQKMLLPFRLCAGGPIGSGKQWVSWIHHADETGLILFALDNAGLAGPLNATAPNPVTNAQLGKALGQALGRPSFMPTPAFALRAMLGEVAQLVTEGQRVLPKKALEAGYVFRFPEIGPALKEILANG